MPAFSSTMAMAAALWPPSWKSTPMRSMRSLGWLASSIQRSKVDSPSPSRQEPTSTMMPPGRTACLALSRAF